MVMPTNRTKPSKMMHKERVHWICNAGRKKVGMLLLFLISAGKGEDGQEVQVPLSLHFNGTSVVNHLSFTYKRRAKYQHSESIFSSHKCHTVSSSSYTFFWLYASSRTSLSHVHLTSCSIKYSAKLILLQYSAKLLKKPDQCRAVYACSHLFWLEDHETIQDGERVLRCLKRALKIANSAQQMTSAARGSTGTVTLFIEILNKYLYFFEKGIPTDQERRIVDIRPICRILLGKYASVHGVPEAERRCHW